MVITVPNSVRKSGDNGITRDDVSSPLIVNLTIAVMHVAGVAYLLFTTPFLPGLAKAFVYSVVIPVAVLFGTWLDQTMKVQARRLMKETRR